MKILKSSILQIIFLLTLASRSYAAEEETKNVTRNAASTGWNVTRNAVGTGWNVTKNAASAGLNVTRNAASAGWNWRTLTPEIQTALQAVQTVLNGGQAPLDTSLTDLKVGLIDALSSLKLNPFVIFNAFITSWRNSLPTLVPIGNYTLLQIALILTIGGLAAGAAVVVAEAFYFKQLHEEEEFQHHLRRAYDNLYYGTKRQETAATSKVKRTRTAPTLPPNRFKPQSLKRTQRRNQRKNKNAGAQLEYYKKVKAAEAKAAAAAEAKRRRGKRQVTFDPSLFVQYPTVAPRPAYIPQHSVNTIVTPSQPLPPSRRVLRPFQQRFPVQEKPSENIFSLTFIKSFLRRHRPAWTKYLPSFPGFGSSSTAESNQKPKRFWASSASASTVSGNPYYERRRDEFMRPVLNFKQNRIS